MTVLFVILAVTSLITIDYFLNRRRKEQSLARKRENPLHFENIDGVKISRQLYFHPLHTWVKQVDYQTAVVGIDDLARRLAGHADRLLLPREGADVQAGLPCVGVGNGSRITRFVTPLTGEIVEVNPALKEKPSLVFEDPYGKGWIFKIRNWQLQDQKRTLLNGSVISDWMRGAVQRMRFGFNGSQQVFAQDAGELCEDICSELDRFEWTRLVKENLGTESIESD